MIDHNQVLEFIRDHENCNRKLIYENFLGNKTGSERRKPTIRILSILGTLQKKGLVEETRIERDTKNHVVNSILKVSNSNSNLTPTVKRRLLRNRKNHTSVTSRVAKSLTIKHRMVLNCLHSIGKPVTQTEISSKLEMIPSTTSRVLEDLLNSKLVRKNHDKTWNLTNEGIAGGKKITGFQELYRANPTDNFFYHIPMLIEQAGETFSTNNIAQRANGYQGFYESQEVPEREATNDFLLKISSHLESESLKNNFIQQNRFLYNAVESEDQLFLWRLYSYLHTVLFKSSKNRKLGMAVFLYGPLLDLLKSKWKEIENKTSSLSKEERFVVLLMLNGVQLETIVPKIEIEEFRNKLTLCDIPFKVYSEGTNHETTIIESIGNIGPIVTKGMRLS